MSEFRKGDRTVRIPIKSVNEPLLWEALRLLREALPEGMRWPGAGIAHVRDLYWGALVHAMTLDHIDGELGAREHEHAIGAALEAQLSWDGPPLAGFAALVGSGLVLLEPDSQTWRVKDFRGFTIRTKTPPEESAQADLNLTNPNQSNPREGRPVDNSGNPVISEDLPGIRGCG